MPARFRKKIKRQRGSGSHGWGGKKKHRGGGSRGGKGMAGMLKQKKSYMIRYMPDHLGKRGFKVPVAVQTRIRAINLKEIDQMASAMGLKEVNVANFGYQKVLGEGGISQPLTVKAEQFSESAKKKIEEAGGKALEAK